MRMRWRCCWVDGAGGSWQHVSSRLDGRGACRRQLEQRLAEADSFEKLYLVNSTDWNSFDLDNEPARLGYPSAHDVVAVLFEPLPDW